MSKTIKIRGEVGKLRNPVALAMIRYAKKSVAHGQTKKAARRANRVLTEREARAMFDALDYARDMRED